MTDALIRLTGRPKIDRDTSGLRRITRTYIVQGSAVTEGNVEDQVFLPYGTPDIEYNATIIQDLSNGGLTNEEVTGAYLVEQNITPGASMNEAILTRVYQELDANNEPVQIGKDQIVRGANDRLTVTRVFIVKNPYDAHYQANRIGEVSIAIGGSTCFLGTVQSKETEVYTEFTEVYFEDGLLSESIQYKYGQYPDHKLEIRTLRSVADVAAPNNTEGPGNGPWFRIDEKEGPGNQDFGQLGKTVRTVVFVKGEGLISKDSEVKGKPPNTVEVSTVKYITGQNGAVPANEIPTFTRRTFEGKDEKDGWELHTIRGVTVNTDNGVVDVKIQYKYGQEPNHKLEIASAKSYGIPADSGDVLNFAYPNGDNTNLGAYVLIEEREDTTGEFDVFTSTFARGNGIISESEKKVGFARVTETVSLHSINEALPVTIQEGELARKVDVLDGYKKLTVSTTTDDSGIVDERTEEKYNGALFIKTIQQLGTEWDEANTPADYVEISNRNHRYDIYPAITKVYAKGSGEISRTTKKLGLAKVYRTVTIYEPDEVIPEDLQQGELSREVDEKDGYKILTLSLRDLDENIIDERTEEFHNGALVVKSITALGSSWDVGNTPVDYIEVSNREHTYQEFPAITKQFAAGEGQIQTRSQEQGLFRLDTFVVLGDDFEAPESALNISVSQEQGYVKTQYDIKIVERDREDFNLTFGQGIQTLERTRIDHSYTTAEANAGKSRKFIDPIHYRETGRNITTTEFEDLAVSYSMGIKKSTTTEISRSSVNDFIDGGSVVQIARDLFRNTKIKIEAAEFSDISVSDNKWYTRTTSREVGQASVAPGEFGGSTSQISENFYLNSQIEIAETGAEGESVNFTNQGALVKTVTTGVGVTGGEEFETSPLGYGLTLGSSTETVAGQLSGEEIKYQGGKKVVTTTSLGDGNLGGTAGSTTQIHPGIFVHRTENSEKWSGLSGKNIYVRTYRRLGVLFTEKQAYDNKPEVDGTEVSSRKDYEYFPLSDGTAEEIIKHTVLGAEFEATSFTTYEIRNFQAPGVIHRQLNGVTVTEPKTVPVWCRILHEIVESPGSFSRSYNPPSATLDMIIGFSDRIKEERVVAGGSNYLLRGNFNAPSKGDTYAGYTVEFCELEEEGDQYSNWSPENSVFATSTSLIYSAGDFKVFHQQEISLNERPPI